LKPLSPDSGFFRACALIRGLPDFGASIVCYIIHRIEFCMQKLTAPFSQEPPMKELSLLEILDEAFTQARDLDAPLAQRLELFANSLQATSPDFAETVDRLIYRLQQSGTGGAAPQVGEKLPSFVLPDSEGHLVRLEDLLATGPLALTFHRGHWCPYCRINTKALSDLQCEIMPKGAQIVAVTPELNHFSTLLKAEHRAAPIRVLTDIDNGYAMMLNLAIFVGLELREKMQAAGIDVPKYQNNDAWILPMPATFIIDRDATIRARFIDPDFRRRMAVEDIYKSLEQAAEPLP
jgi:peroxiredoxin